MKAKVIFLVIATLAIAKSAWGQEIRVARDMEEALEMARHSSCVISSGGGKRHHHHGYGVEYVKGRQANDDYDQDDETQPDYDDYGSEEDDDDDPPPRRRQRPPPGPVGPPVIPTYPVNLPIQFPLNVGQVLGSITGALPQNGGGANLGGFDFTSQNFGGSNYGNLGSLANYGNFGGGIPAPQRDPGEGTEVSLSSAPDWGAMPPDPEYFGGKGGKGKGSKGKGGKGGKGKGGKGKGKGKPGNINCIIITKKKPAHKHHKKKAPPLLFGFLPISRRRRDVARAMKQFKNL